MEVNPNLSQKAIEDLDLVKRAIQNDQKAYAELMTRYKDAIYFMLLKMVNNKEDANDLTVEAFGKAFENIEKYRPEFAFSYLKLWLLVAKDLKPEKSLKEVIQELSSKLPKRR